MSILSIAVSGLSAASLRVNVAASNIANARTTGPLPASGGSGPSAGGGSPSIGPTFPAAYVPLQVNQVSQSSGSMLGGTAATVSAVSPSFTAEFDPSAPFANGHGLVAAPNVDLASEIAELTIAKYSFIASAKVIQAYAETMDTLLEIKS